MRGVDSRSTTSVPTAPAAASVSPSARRSARRPISSSGTRTVVSGGRDVAHGGDVVEAGDSDIGAGGEPGVADGREGADGHDVVGREDELDAVESAAEQLLHARHSRRRG